MSLSLGTKATPQHTLIGDPILSADPGAPGNEAAGIRVNGPRVTAAVPEMAAKLAELDLQAQAYCGYPMSLSQVKQLQWWFYEYEKMPVQKAKVTKKPTIGDEAVVTLLKLYEGHPLLTARAAYAETQQVKSHYLDSLVASDGRCLQRIYPDYSIRAQANGRYKMPGGSSSVSHLGRTRSPPLSLS